MIKPAFESKPAASTLNVNNNMAAKPHANTIAQKPAQPKITVEKPKEEAKQPSNNDDFKNSLASLIGRPRPMKKTPVVTAPKEKIRMDSLFDQDNVR